MTFDEKISPGHTALINIDIQRDFFCEGGIIDLMGYDYKACRAILEPLEAFIKACRRHLKCIIFTKQCRYPFFISPSMREHYERARMARPLDPGVEEFYAILPGPGDITLPKHRASAFIGTPLDHILRANGIKTLILTGIATNVCVESTAREGSMKDYFVVVPSDLVAGVNEEARKMALFNIDRFFGEVVVSDKIIRTWGQTSQPI